MRKSNPSYGVWHILLLVALLLILCSAFALVRHYVHVGSGAAKTAFLETYESAREATREQYYERSFALAEAQHHVHNEVAISIQGIREKSALEVLHISDVVYIVTDADQTASGTTSWLKVFGSGVFTVNLTAAEYVVDSNRQYVLVRVPRPVLDSSNITVDQFESLYFAENVWRSDNSIKSGEALARNQLSEAKQRIQEDFEASEQYYKLAESSTRSILRAWIAGINPEVENLTVEVEFY